jgi:MFS family permease
MLRNPALIAFALAFLLSMFFRSFFGVIGPEISSALSLSRAQFGWLSAAYFAAFALFQLPVGLLFDRFGVRWPTTVLMGVGVAGSALLAISQTSAMAIWGQIGLGIGCAPIFMGLLYHAGRILQAPDAGRAAASVSALGSIGALVSASPLAWFVTVAGWRVAVGASSVALALSAAAVATLVRDGSRQQSKMEWSS